MAAERFEERHRALREGRANPGFAETEPMRARRLEELQRFEARTRPLVDDLVAAVREEQSREDVLATEHNPRLRTEVLAQLTESRRRRRAALAALDEASARG